MNTVNEYLESGLLELYVLGLASEEEAAAIAQLALTHPEIRSELENIEAALLQYARSQAAPPPDTAKAMLLATIDYTTRLQNGEAPEAPPLLHAASSPDEYASWLNRPDMVRPDDADPIFLKLIGANAQATTAILWLSEGAPGETHEDEHERFLILEGTCDIVVGETTTKLKAGDYFEIPLHVVHNVKVTSDYPCKIILQRVAA